MTLSISPSALFILQVLQQAGFEAYIVGGAVRDLVMASIDKVPPTPLLDYDFTTNARPEDIQKLFPENFYENNFGTVSVTPEHLRAQMQILPKHWSKLMPAVPPRKNSKIIDHTAATKLHQSLTPASQLETDHLQPTYQITTYRSDEVYDDFRRPTSMNWGQTLDEDLDRRDFTINAMALQISPEVVNRKLTNLQTQPKPAVQLRANEFTIIDKHQGLVDLEAHVVRTVGDPDTRFQEDALRMLRAIRFAVQLNLHIAEPTFTSIQKNAQLITNISWERIRDELLKMLTSPFPAEAIELLDEAKILQYVLPELLETKGIQQGGHHTTDVWTHSLDALRTTPSPDPIVRLATLLHDIAKPKTQAFTANTITFYNHEIIGARMVKKIGERLRLSKQEIERIFILVRFHMFHYQPHDTDAAIRRFMRKVGLENIDDILDLREGDRLGSGARQTSWRLEEMKQRMIEQLHQPLEVTDLAINGNDLMTEFNLKPGPEIGRVLQILFEQVLENPDLNHRASLLRAAGYLLEEKTTSFASIS